MNPFPLRRHRLAGFTLIELMISVSLIAILVGIAAPGLRNFVMNARLTGQANDLFTDLLLTRSEAVKRDVQVTLCASTAGTDCDGGSWSAGWIVVIDADGNGKLDSGTFPLKRVDGLTGSNTLTRTLGGAAASFSPTGVAVGGASAFQLCDSRTDVSDNGRVISISTTGRTSITKIKCP